MWTRGASPGLPKTEISLSCEHVEPRSVSNKDITPCEHLESLVCLKQRYHCHVNTWNPGVSKTDTSHDVNTRNVSWFVGNRYHTCEHVEHFNLVCLKQWHVMWTLGASRSGFSKTGTCYANTSQSGLSKTGTWTLEISALSETGTWTLETSALSETGTWTLETSAASETGTWTLETSALKQGHEHLKHLLCLKQGHEHLKHLLRLKKGHEHFICFL